MTRVTRWLTADPPAPAAVLVQAVVQPRLRDASRRLDDPPSEPELT